jgi:hypothetical protein
MTLFKDLALSKDGMPGAFVLADAVEKALKGDTVEIYLYVKMSAHTARRLRPDGKLDKCREALLRAKATTRVLPITMPGGHQSGTAYTVADIHRDGEIVARNMGDFSPHR